MIIIISIITFFVAGWLVYVFGVQNNPEVNEYKRIRRRFVTYRACQEIKVHKEKPYGALIFIFVIGMLVSFWLMRSGNVVINRHTHNFRNLQAIVHFIFYLVMYVLVWYYFLLSLKDPPVFVFSTRGVLYARAHVKSTEITPIFWAEIKEVNILPHDIRLTYLRDDNRLRTIVIPNDLIGNNQEKVTQLFIDYGAKVNIKKY